MLVVKSTIPTENRRIEVAELLRQLNIMRQNCEDADFATRRVPHHKSKRSWDSEEAEDVSVKRREMPRGDDS